MPGRRTCVALKKPRLIAALFILRVTCCGYVYGQGAVASPVTQGKTIEIPEGTPVVVHFYGADKYIEYNASVEKSNDRVLQVDQDVVVNGVVVVPRGSVGYAHIDKQVVSQVRRDLGPRNGIVRAHVYGPKENRVTQIVFHSEYVFSIASTQLQLDRTPDYIDEAHHNAEASQPPLPTLDYKPDS